MRTVTFAFAQRMLKKVSSIRGDIKFPITITNAITTTTQPPQPTRRQPQQQQQNYSCS